MEFIIDFFRGIDGWPYYIMLVVNTILIFAIIGYLGEKNNEQLLKLSTNAGTSNLKSGTMNLTPVHSSPSHNDANIPKVEATPITNSQNVSVANNVQPTSPILTNQPANGTAPVVNQSPVANSPIPTINQAVKPIIRPEDNEVDPNEKAPAVLIINSSDNNKDVK